MTARNDQRGVVYVETLVAFMPIFIFFLGTLQVADESAAHLIVEHASTAAARAAVVVLPDDGAYYGDPDNELLDQFAGNRRLHVERAADTILAASPRLGLGSENVALDKPTYQDREDLTATVRAHYVCFIPFFCPNGIDMAADSSLVYQGARYEYKYNTEFVDGVLSRLARAVIPGSSETGTDSGAGTEPPKGGAAAGESRDADSDDDRRAAGRPPRGRKPPPVGPREIKPTGGSGSDEREDDHKAAARRPPGGPVDAPAKGPQKIEAVASADPDADPDDDKPAENRGGRRGTEGAGPPGQGGPAGARAPPPGTSRNTAGQQASTGAKGAGGSASSQPADSAGDPASATTGGKSTASRAGGTLRPMARTLSSAGDDLLLKKAVNSNLPHAVSRGVERGVFGSADEAATALRGLTEQITKTGTFPTGTLVDTARAGRFLVPIGNGGRAVYQLAKNGTAKLKTVLISR